MIENYDVHVVYISWLRALAAPRENLGLMPSTQRLASHNCP